MLDVSLKQLEVFVAVAECGSFSLAAERLFLSQSTVSSHVAGLERTLGQQLLLRGSRRRVALTTAGEEVYAAGRGIIAQCQQLQERFTAPVPVLHIGASTVPTSHILPQLMAGFRAAMPACRFSLARGNSEEIHHLLTSGQLQLGFVGKLTDPHRLTYHRLCSDSLVLVAPNTPLYQEKARAKALGKQLLDGPLILRSQGSGTQAAVEQYLSKIHRPLDTLQVVARMEQNEGLLQSVFQGLGCAILSELVAKDWVDNGRVLAFPLDDPPVTRDFYLAYPKDAALPPVVEQFISFCLENYH